MSIGSGQPDQFPEAYEDLANHLKATNREMPLDETTRFLTIEDFNTKGLLGPINKRDENQGSLYSFWWEEGRSNKRKGSGGSHGVGKSTLSGASRSSCFLALTRRSSDEKQELLIGYSILPPHKLGEKEYLGYARFGKRHHDGNEKGRVIHPYAGQDDAGLLERFRNHAKLKRQKETGLSIFIPALKDEINENKLIQAVIENFFFPIVKECLIVEVRNHESGKHQVISKENILALIEDIESEKKLRSAVEVALEATSIVKNGRFFFPRPDFEFSKESDRLSSDSFTEENIRDMRQMFEGGQVVAARLAIPIKMANGNIVTGHADIFAKGGGDTNHKTYKAFRGNILIEREKCSASQPFEVLILDIFNGVSPENELSEYLKYSEDPGHTKWHYSALRRSSDYASSEHWQRRCVQHFGSSFLALLSGDEDQEKIEDFADDIFYLKKKTESESHRKNGAGLGKKSGSNSPVPKDIPPPPPQFFRIQKQPNGQATIQGTDILDEMLKKSGSVRGRVWAANIIFGKSKAHWRKRHIPSDFDFRKDEMIESKGVDITVNEPNCLDFVATQKDFCIKFTGFDTNRDIHIDVRTVVEAGK